MFLFIFESIGTSEMILVGIVALIFLGPRKLPELAKKAGKIMSEFRGTASEFKETWQREVNFDKEVKSLSLSNLEADSVPGNDLGALRETTTTIPDPPAIRAADPESFRHLVPRSDEPIGKSESAETPQINDKKNWL